LWDKIWHLTREARWIIGTNPEDQVSPAYANPLPGDRHALQTFSGHDAEYEGAPR
jgi:hypothetical protein